MNLLPRPLVWNYLSSRDFVVAYDDWAKGSLRGYSRRTFSRWAQISSPNAITLIVSGKRKLSREWLPGFVRGAKLLPVEGNYLALLVDLEMASDRETRERLLEEAYRLVSRNNGVSLAGDTLTLLKNPLAWTLYHMLTLKGQDGSAKWFKAKLLNRHAVPEIQQGLLLLERLKLAERLPNGSLKAKANQLESSDQIKAEQNASFHRHVLSEATQFIDNHEPAQRAFGSLTVVVPEDRAEEFKAEVNKFGRMLLKKYDVSAPASGTLYRLNVQLYPLTLQESES